MDAAVFRARAHMWIALEAQYGREVTPSRIEKEAGVNHGLWTLWLSGKGKYRSQQVPNPEQWEQLRLLGFTWHAVFEDVYRGAVQEVVIPNRTCPMCSQEFHARGNQQYDIWFCRDWAAHLRHEDRRKAPAAALRAV